MTEKEYLSIYNRYPDPNSNSKYHAHYEGEEKDYELLTKYNKRLVKEFPFLIPRNRWTGEVVEDYNYSYTELDSMPAGWRIAFGLDMMKEIKQVLLDAQEKDPNGGYDESWITTKYTSEKIIPYLEGFRIVEIKEKYGSLRFYCNSAPEGVQEVINKYEKLSWHTCINCGKPAKFVSTG